MTDEPLLQEEYDLDLRDAFTRAFSWAERWMRRAKRAERELARIEAFLNAPASSLGDAKTMVYVDELRAVMRGTA